MSSKVRFIAVVDFGSQYVHLITRVLRELGVAARTLPPTAKAMELRQAAGVILSGSPRSVLKNAVPYRRHLTAGRLPTLGICYGQQLVAHERGGTLTPGKIREYGKATLELTLAGKRHLLLAGVAPHSQVWMSHGDSVTKLPQGFVRLGSTASLPLAAVAHRTKPIFGVQFHPEVTHTAFGRSILTNFAFSICNLKPTTSIGTLEKISTEIKTQVGAKKKVFLLVSGGVDSTVAFTLLNRILGTKRVYGLHLNTGLMRTGETRQVKLAIKQLGFKNLHVVNAAPDFFQATKGLTEPEAKRQAIGETFLKVKDRIAAKLGGKPSTWLLGQGTIYPDTIESAGTKHAAKIKTHHNRIGVLQTMAAQGLLAEPLKELYKDEVRELGQQLGLPQKLLWQHPFPGPGLGVRILCLSKRDVAEFNHTNFPHVRLGHYHTRVLPVRSVGVQGDERSYAHPLAVDAPYAAARQIHAAGRTLLNRHRHLNRVVLKLAGPTLSAGTSHLAYLIRKRVKLLQQAEAMVIYEIKRASAYYKLWQCPVVLLPFGTQHGESIVIRPFTSREVMTGEAYVLPQALVARITRKLRKLPVDYLFYDLTDKPPGTVEWE